MKHIIKEYNPNDIILEFLDIIKILKINYYCTKHYLIFFVMTIVYPQPTITHCPIPGEDKRVVCESPTIPWLQLAYHGLCDTKFGVDGYIIKAKELGLEGIVLRRPGKIKNL